MLSFVDVLPAVTELVSALQAESGGSAYAGTCTNGGRAATAGTGRNPSSGRRTDVIG
jgi:hypothetical protein